MYITVKDYALKNNISEKTVYNHMKNGKIKKERIKKVLNTTLIKQ